ncbi:MAG TPA: heterodisulfide reductase-related iron-sulfur binding cluster [Longimicrobiales bacterium]|nr:heterodisulfide reductase-related iron-sulfur binding cluster [Longimicrobiales bacterium]
MSESIVGLADILRREEAGLLACVHCGFCLSACPTYTRLGDEADSPRGRLYLMRAVAEGRLDPAAPAFRTHIDRCLGCRACEPVCPSGVPYGFLVERARTVVAEAGGADPVGRLLLWTFGHRFNAAVAGWKGRIFRSGGFAAALARLLPRRLRTARYGLAMLAATRPWRGLRAPPAGLTVSPAAGGGTTGATSGSGVPAVARRGSAAEVAVQPERAAADPHALAAAYPAGTSLTAEHAGARPQPRVALLRGCVQSALFGHVNAATGRVLRAAGCELVEVRSQRCCGALHAHGGALEDARSLARANVAAFTAAGADYVVVNAAGCGAMLKEYGEQLRDDVACRDAAHALATRVRDLSELLVELDLPRGAPLPLRVTYDAPCHLHHAQRITRAPLDLLRQVPQLELVALPGAEECCGGAGTYGLTHAELGGRILDDKVDAILGTGADVVATPNPGCIMQIGAGLALRGSRIPVLHPIELLDESYRRAGFYS